ncbi:hypothetical protein CCP3SC1AL1_430011 [Gammaproteobacteria bacterium]
MYRKQILALILVSVVSSISVVGCSYFNAVTDKLDAATGQDSKLLVIRPALSQIGFDVRANDSNADGRYLVTRDFHSHTLGVSFDLNGSKMVKTVYLDGILIPLDPNGNVAFDSDVRYKFSNKGLSDDMITELENVLSVLLSKLRSLV